MTDADWLKTILATAGVLIVAWAIWISRTVSGGLSREEHRNLCEDREKRVACDLEEIKQMIRDNNKEAIDSRHRLSNRIQELALTVAGSNRRTRPDDENGRG